MGQQSWRAYLLEMTELPDEKIGHSIIELAGDSRVLIENHSGMQYYSEDRIGVKVSYGRVIIEGNDLEIGEICKKQLIVVGKIKQIILEQE